MEEMEEECRKRARQLGCESVERIATHVAAEERKDAR
jgi:hypothetical protein